MKSKPKSKKLFIIDTNVLLHDPKALWQFEENDLALPIAVLEEVDHFKRGSDTINLHAREIARELDDLAAMGSLNEGVPRGEGLGQIQVLVTGRIHPRIAENLLEDNSDHRILSTALTMQDKIKNRQVILVSKDVSLRLKARSLGVRAEDYETDKAPELKELYKGRYELKNIDDTLIDRLFQDPYFVPLEDFGIEEPYPNSYFILRGFSKSAIARYDATEGTIMRVEKRPAFGINPRNSEQTFALDALINPNIQLVTLSGKAGTGKTLLALAGALEARRKYHQIYLARPIIALSNKDIGYLPGEVKDKIDPYMQPLWDNLGVIRSQFKNNGPTQDSIQSMLDNQKLLISALAFIRGRSLHHIYFIVDEAQNLTGHEVKTIITRAGEGTKIVLTGDPQQIDSPYLDSRSNGLTRLIDKMKGQKIYAHVTLEKGERSLLSDLASTLL
ncbi:MAG: PhoH family protein [bacterium]